MVGLNKSEPVLRLKDGVAFRVIDGEGVVVLPTAKKIIGINGTAARFIELLDGKKNLQKIAAILSDEYEASLAEVQADTLSLAGDLLGRGVLEEVGS